MECLGDDRVSIPNSSFLIPNSVTPLMMAEMAGTTPLV